MDTTARFIDEQGDVMNCVMCYVNSKGTCLEPALFVYKGESFCLVHFTYQWGIIDE